MRASRSHETMLLELLAGDANRAMPASRAAHPRGL